jgi:hypothetical protein
MPCARQSLSFLSIGGGAVMHDDIGTLAGERDGEGTSPIAHMPNDKHDLVREGQGRAYHWQYLRFVMRFQDI